MALSHIENTSSLDKNKRPTPCLYLPLQEATTRKGGSLLRRQLAVARRPRTTVYNRFHVIYILPAPITISEVHILICPIATLIPDDRADPWGSMIDVTLMHMAGATGLPSPGRSWVHYGGSGPSHRPGHQINRFCCLGMSSNIHRTTIIRFVADEPSPTDTSAVISAGEYGDPQVSLMHSASFGWQQPILTVSLPLPLFAMQPVTPDIGHSFSVVTQKYSSWPGPGRRPLVWI